MVTWESALRGAIYAAALLPLLALHALLALLLPSRIPLPALLPLAAAAVAALAGPEAGAGYGLLAGFLYGLAQPETLALPLAVLALALLGFLGGHLRACLPKGFPGAVLLALGLLLGLLLPRALWWMLTQNASVGAVVRLLGGELLASLLAFPAVYALYVACQGATRHLAPAPQGEIS